MEQNSFQRKQNDDDDDEMTSDPVMESLHLPPGLDLLFQMLDEMSEGSIPQQTEKITPTPYFRTPSLGS